MFRQTLRTNLNSFVEKIGNTLGYTAEEIHHSERFEQAVYDMAKTAAKLPDIDFSHKAFFGYEDINRFRITYDTHNVSTQKLAEFYLKNFPETDPQYVYGLVNSISFLAEPFIQKVLPTMKLWRTRPSCIGENNIHYIDNSEMLLKSPINPEFGNAVFITGADPLLGEWKSAIRLKYNETSKAWEFKLPEDVKENEFKFMTGSFDLGEKVSTSQLSYEAGANRTLIIHDPVNTNTPVQEQPSGYGVRC